MNVGVHPRIEARRREVREHGAHRRLRVVLALMLLVGLGGLGFWLLHSPLLAVDRIVVGGDLAEAEVTALAATGGLEIGDPIAFVERGAVTDALLADPRVAAARVVVRYPHEVAIDVVAHRPVAWVAAGSAWLHVTASGHVVASAGEPGPGPRVGVSGLDAEPGATLVGDAAAAVEFVAALPPDLGADARVEAGERGLVAVVAGHDVVLGAPVRIADKAAAVTALTKVVEDGAALDVSAPDRPAVRPPAAANDEQPEDQVEG